MPDATAVLFDQVDQKPEGNTGPFVGADEAVGVLNSEVLIGLVPIFPAIPRAFDENCA